MTNCIVVCSASALSLSVTQVKLPANCNSNEGRGLFSPVGQDCQWVHRPSPEKVLVKLGTKHLAVLETSSVMNSMKAHQEGSFNEVPLWCPSF